MLYNIQICLHISKKCRTFASRKININNLIFKDL